MSYIDELLPINYRKKRSDTQYYNVWSKMHYAESDSYKYTTLCGETITDLRTTDIGLRPNSDVCQHCQKQYERLKKAEKIQI